jgi:hypothetical protein
MDKFNTTILCTVPGDSHCYMSSNSIEGSHDNSNEEVFSDPEFLNSLQEPGISPHELILKIGAICRLTRNFDASCGLTKNTQVIVWKLLRHTVEVEQFPQWLPARLSIRYVKFTSCPAIIEWKSDSAPHPSHKLPFSTTWLWVHSPSKTDPSCAMLCNHFEWLPGPNCWKIGAQFGKGGVLTWATLFCHDPHPKLAKCFDSQVWKWYLHMYF